MKRENNACVLGRIKDLLDILDARARVAVFVGTMEKNEPVRNCYVYELLNDNWFLRTYKNYRVSGLVVGLYNNILIEEDR